MAYRHHLTPILVAIMGMLAATALSSAQRDADQPPPFSESSPLKIVPELCFPLVPCGRDTPEFNRWRTMNSWEGARGRRLRC
jgi:hypothetical protein